MEDSGCLIQSSKNETVVDQPEIKTIKRKPTQKGNLIILPETGLSMRKLPPIVADKNVRLPSKTPSSPLVQVFFYNHTISQSL